MGRKNKPKTGQPPARGLITIPEPPVDKMRFSFRFFDSSNPKFSLQDCQSGYLETLLDRLKSICQMRVTEFRQQAGNPKSLRSHAINSSATTEPNGFSQVPKLRWEAKQWQFELSLSKHGRVHGFLDGNVFNIVWFDPGHKLYVKH